MYVFCSQLLISPQFLSALASVKMWQMAPNKQLKSIEMTNEQLDDINRRLEDLHDNSESSQAKSARALNLIRQLEYETMPDINLNVEQITLTSNFIDENILTAENLLNTSVENYNTAGEEMEVRKSLMFQLLYNVILASISILKL